MSREQKVFDLKDPRIMWDIVREMREIPELPSEQPKDVQPLTRVEFKEKGGVVTYMGSMPFPYKGFPFFEFVDKVDVLKKLGRAFLSGCYHELKNKKLLLIPLVFLTKPLTRVALYIAYRHIDRFKIKPEMYCDAVRELYKAFTADNMTEFQVMFRDVLCMTLEMDNAYRYRFQDIIVNVNKDRLHKNPRKELLKLLAILSERERTQDIKDTWTLIRLAISLYLFIDKEFKRTLIGGLIRLELDEVKLTIEDKLYGAGRKDYVFGFMLTPEVEGAFCLRFNQMKDSFESESKIIRDMSTKEHEGLFQKQVLEQKLIARKVSDEELAKINAEIAQKSQELLKIRDATIQKAIDEHNKAEKEMVSSYLTTEQKTLADIHGEETKKLDEEWTSKLIERENNYKNLCQQHLSSYKAGSPLLGKP